jgi:Replication protein C C-terminal region
VGAENRTHSTTTTLIDNDKDHTVIAAKHCSGVEVPPVPDDQEQPKPKHLFPEKLHITPMTLVELAPRLAPYMPARYGDQNWPAVVEAALFLSGEMGINRTLWIRACQIMGREYAAVAMAVVSTHPAEHFTKSAGSYFGGMVKKFEKNPQDLCLSRTLWRLKEQIWDATGHKERRDVERQRRIEPSARRSLHPDLDTAGSTDAPQAPINSSGGFRLVGAVLPRQLAAPTLPARRAIAAPADRPAVPSVYSRTWQPS